MSDFYMELRYVCNISEKLKFTQMSEGSSRCGMVQRVLLGHRVAEHLELLCAGFSA